MHYKSEDRPPRSKSNTRLLIVHFVWQILAFIVSFYYTVQSNPLFATKPWSYIKDGPGVLVFPFGLVIYILFVGLFNMAAFPRSNKEAAYLFIAPILLSLLQAIPQGGFGVLTFISDAGVNIYLGSIIAGCGITILGPIFSAISKNLKKNLIKEEINYLKTDGQALLPLAILIIPSLFWAAVLIFVNIDNIFSSWDSSWTNILDFIFWIFGIGGTTITYYKYLIKQSIFA